MASKNYSSIRIPKLRYNAFDLTHEKKLSFQMGQLIPIMWFDCVPGDRFRVTTELLIRLAPLLAPLLHRIDAFVHTFFVPYRIIWEDFEDFITGGPDGLYTATMPYVVYNEANKIYFDKGKLSDYLGIPPTAQTITDPINISFLPFSAYYRILDDYYFREDIDTFIEADNGSGNQSNEYYSNDDCRNRHLEMDYLTGAGAYAFRASSAELDLDIVGDETKTFQFVDKTDGGLPAGGAPVFTGANNILYEAGPGNPLAPKNDVASPFQVTLELTELRRAQALLRYLELNNLQGHRYAEHLQGRWQVKPQDARLQDPEYIGGFRIPIQISEIQNTSQVLDPTAGVNDGAGGVPVTVDPQANMSGKGLGVGSGRTIKYFCNEHGILMSILSVMPRVAWQEQIERFWVKTDKTEFYTPEFARLGEQEVLNHEAFWDGTNSDYDDTFGYQARYAEYKYARSSVHGDFIDDFDYWHMGRVLGSQPTLNSTFLTCESTDYDRVFAVTTGTVDKLYAQVLNNVQAVRPMPPLGALPI